ncbi:sugar phosphate nucleotidyltransferase [Desulfosporosinus sp. BICA1-9]|uniref:sugar phosphate nucleotidyltransferase n=1 Tax=Desulfosporosinus sp. BICA1-9 TaxID=1531958 RepID=UPI0005F25714|nr:sugar phosphate nucleotidyltransferase [Desulfosporosinus sp. BICA1-9]KJS49034.1 MAG: mannose-1-phosphate guanylyltransferase [Peptococcaceae bacterium BRH_c23]KJS90765.1 MAG: mannose-1-phosphate guanylyltransferase [Desulfosporosinus sp. BICA1-9]HBW35512.1 mannose-1-phosphate guanylyltransferase [Desulfosporosinus sp.]
MKLVLLSGGSGKRLWPLSNDARSKQFLKVLQNEQGEPISMVQRVWEQLESVGLAHASLVATSKAQVDMIQGQLGQAVKMIVEPERRDTFPAIALAASYLYSVEKIGLDETVVVLPVDPHVEVGFFSKIKELQKVLEESEANLALIGVSPTFPSEKYGYIVPELNQDNMLYSRVSHFREKPKGTDAKELIRQQALWNCGVFAFKLDFIISQLDQKGFPIDYEELLMQYTTLPKISFDYEVVEKAKHIVVLRYDGDWKDLGTWNTLTEEMPNVLVGNAILSEDSLNTHVINELDIPVVVLGISNAVVAVSPDGILVTDKDSSPSIKDFVGKFDLRPMFEERRWGWYRVLDHTKFTGGNEVLTKRLSLIAGKNFSYQFHNKRSEVWTIISGEGQYAFNGVVSPVNPGDVLNIPIGAKHGLRALTDLEFIEVQMGSELIEEDIVRIYMTWEEVESHCTWAQCSAQSLKVSGA